MGRKLLGYDDAVKLLGGDSKLVTALGKLAGAGLAGASLAGLAHGNVPAAVGLFELKDEIVREGQEAVGTLRQRLTGLNRFKRSELLQAAHAVLVVSAFFAALDDLGQGLRTALNSKSLNLVKSEQVQLASTVEAVDADGIADLMLQLTTRGRIPGLDSGLARQGRSLSDYYARLAVSILKFARGTAVWDHRDETVREKWSLAVRRDLPLRALARYEEQLVRLAGEFPEFAFWAHRVGTQEILEELRAARQDTTHLEITLQTAAGVLASAARGSDPDKVRSDLVARYREQIARPVAGTDVGSVPEGVQLPALRELYVNPSYKALQLSRTTGTIEQLADPGWQETVAYPGLGAMVLAHLISTEAAEAPLVLLGQPGAGKSVFTQMLAAELDPRDFLVIRVELRAVPADTGIQEQIEAALRHLTGRSIRWPDLADSAGDAQPVILLDGFDELLQASGVSHADFLERVREFQEREMELRRPVAVLVTSRTAVANQVRYPDGTLVARLEEFDSEQVACWLDVWNEANPARPLAVETALAQGELARQPLLMFLLAFFHSGGGNLTPGISQAQLFQQLFTNFVERDVRKLDASLNEREQQRAVRQDLDHLSMVAFAMFNRGHQSVTETDLMADLVALQPDSVDASMATARAVALSTAERLAGRFFFRLFVHRDQAMHGQQAMLSTYEFLHASFGEFLVARWIASELSRLGEQVRRAADDPYPRPPDDSKLHALLSVTVLSVREQRVLGFIADLLTGKTPDDLADLRGLVGSLFRSCLQPQSHTLHAQYQPVVRTVPAVYAAYSANLVLLLLLIGEAQVRATGDAGLARLSGIELDVVGAQRVSSEYQLAKFHTVARLWHSQLTPSEWESLLDVVRVYPQPEDPRGNQAAAVGCWTANDYQALLSGNDILYNSPHLYLREDALIRLDTRAGKQFREAALLGTVGYRGAAGALLSYINALGLSGNAPAFQTGSTVADLLALLLPARGLDGISRAHLYEDVFMESPGIRPARLLLGQLCRDIRQLPPTVLSRIVLLVTPYAWAHITAYLDILSWVKEVASPQEALAQVTVKELIELDTAERLHTIMRELGAGNRPVSLLKLAVPRLLLALTYTTVLNESTHLSDLRDLLRLPRTHRDIDPLVLIGLYCLPEFVRLIGVLDLLDVTESLEPHDLRNLNKLNGPIDREDARADKALISLVQIALWAALTERRLSTEPPPPALLKSDVRRLAAMVPEFVARTNRLAYEHGFPSPLPLEPQP